MQKNSSKDTKNEYKIPIVAVMGHVDHGKTSILDAIRGTSVQKKEVGGITQNTRAHVVVTKSGQKITFIDTPGHEAFSGMRSRGAKVTDIVLLVVAGDDGVKPQTIESIKFAKEARVPIVVAINKMDLPNSNSDKVKQELAKNGVQVEEFGGDVLVVEVSAKTQKGLDELLETLLLQAEMLELKPVGVQKNVSQAIVLESSLDPKLGPVALVLVRAGIIERSNFVLYKDNIYKIRTLLDENQKQIDIAKEGEPAWIIGLDQVIDVGEKILIVKTYDEAKNIIKQKRDEKQDINQDNKADDIDTEDSEDDSIILSKLLDDKSQSEEIKKLNVILKTDTKGTLEAIIEQLNDLSDEEVSVNIVFSGTGDITQKDIDLAKNSKAIILGFQIKISNKLEEIAKREKVPFRIYNVIYDLLDEVSIALDSLIEPEFEEVEIAVAKVKQVFVLSNKKKVAGCEVIKGTILKGYSILLRRGEEEVARGKIVSLKHKKEEVKEMKKGQECGILIEPQADIEIGDEIVAIKKEKI